MRVAPEVLAGLVILYAWSTRSLAHDLPAEPCPRPAAASEVEEPEDLHSINGVLSLDLSVHNEAQADGSMRYCYLLPDGHQSPTLRVKPGDMVILRLRNQLSVEAPDEPVAGHQHHHREADTRSDPCSSDEMSLTSTNLHFHGLLLPPVCHQDDVLKTSIQPTDPPFEYRFRIPDNQPPGLYWYHPHIHGFSSKQVLGGASGALIVEGIERANPEVAGLPDRVLIVRDQDLLSPDAPPSPGEATRQALMDRDGDAANTGTGTGKPAKDLSVNYVPVPYPDYPLASLKLKPGERQLWRVLNASSVTYLNLAALYKRGAKFRPEWLGVVAIDGVPINGAGLPGHSTEWRDSIVVSPGARVEFIITAPPAGVPAMFVTRTVDTGDGGENDPNRPLLSIVGTPDALMPRFALPASTGPLPASGLPWLGNVTPTRVRKLYFSEDASHFYLTVEGQTPATFDPASTEPNIVVKQGEVEDWIIENRSTELHAFHIHQLHFEVLDWLGFAVNEPFLRDTVNIPFFSPIAMTKYPTVRLRMDFRDPSTVGTFIYHCHLLDHEDGGMMGMIRVEPANASARSPTAAREPLRARDVTRP
jgi:FtsP/CotA-like multicopper oxidase with cupredoxin domain